MGVDLHEQRSVRACEMESHLRVLPLCDNLAAKRPRFFLIRFQPLFKNILCPEFPFTTTIRVPNVYLLAVTIRVLNLYLLADGSRPKFLFTG